MSFGNFKEFILSFIESVIFTAFVHCFFPNHNKILFLLL